MSILLSVVSHKQADLVHHLLGDVQPLCLHRNPEVIVTINVEEEIPFKDDDFDFKIRIIHNETPKGFGANHNQAFKLTRSRFFSILNPDVRLIQDPFRLLSPLEADPRIGIIAPLIMNEDHSIEDSARRLPTPGRLLRRIFNRKKDGKLDYNMNKMIYPDWLAGIFMVLPSHVFAAMNGFDDRYYLYFEDVDLCSRLRLAGYRVVLDPSVSVIHEARRDSHRRLRYLLWHTISGFRFFSSPIFWATLIKEFKS
jgi:N-acetylglucosaminyl-diphospho-decaprenol L-rhamnosyltransferase